MKREQAGTELEIDGSGKLRPRGENYLRIVGVTEARWKAKLLVVSAMN